MRIPRICYEPELRSHSEVKLQGQSASHLSKVLRLKKGYKVTLFDGQGISCPATITNIERQCVTLQTGECQPSSNESPIHITLVQAISKGERMDWVFQKATELGVSRFIPVYGKRSVVKLDEKRLANRIKHWHSVITHACEQCGRNTLPTLSSPIHLNEAIHMRPSELCCFLDPESNLRSRELEPANAITFYIGPEGGFDSQEKQLMLENGIHGLNMGPRILRTETAALTAITSIGALWGDL